MYGLKITILLLVSSGLLFSQSGKNYYRMLSDMYKNSVPLVKADEVKRSLEKNETFILLDTREKAEYNVSHIEHAVFTGYNNFDPEVLDTLAKNAKVVVYCSVGYRSERIGEQLLAEGFTNVSNLYGGIFEWINLDFPLKDSSSASTRYIHAYDKTWGKWLKKGIKVYE